MMTLEEFGRDLIQELARHSDAGGQYLEDSFFEHYCELLVETGELSDFTRASYGTRGIRVDGFEGDPVAYDGTLTLIISDFSQSGDKVETITNTELLDTFKRLHRFLTESRRADFRNKLDESLEAFGLSEMIAKRWSRITRVRLILITNRVLSVRVDRLPAGEIEGVPVAYSVWDIGRIHKYVSSGTGREEFQIDLVKDFGGAIPVLPAHLDGAGYEAYLTVIPGQQLADIFERWGNRLLEQNVRVFLQARGNVNKGIRNTLLNEPEMFFAYNNGITATAEDVTIQETSTGLEMTHLKNLQIVNGGQTTASIHAASRAKADLSHVFVQMKLSIIETALTPSVVPRIAEYANSQNRVNSADFFSNHAFHIRMEEFSRRILAPSSDGGLRESKWFYERARGQYQSERANLTPANQKKFDLEFPKSQLFSKTDLAKWVFSWEGRPDTVSKGAQKNFAEFATYIGEAWEKDSTTFSDEYYKESIAKGIVFRRTERLVQEQPWYEGGYRANIVTYAIAKIAHDVKSVGAEVDLGRIWKNQDISPDLREALALAGFEVHEILTNPPSSNRNVTEWAKKSECWTRIKGLRIEWPANFLSELESIQDVRVRRESGIKVQKLSDGIFDQTTVVNAGADLWQEVGRWALEQRLLSHREQGILGSAYMIPIKIPTEKQSAAIIRIHKRLLQEGCPHGRDIYAASAR